MSWDFFPLYLFPGDGLAGATVITTVWVGVAVVAFLNLRFGWSLAGLVVPGYLIPLLMIRPASVVVIVGEGMITYLLVRATSALGGRYLGLADFFGRDRFYALVLASVIVRVAFDAFWLPALGAWINDSFGLRFDYATNLHSFGLIIVALIANNFWKPGIARGTLWLLVTLGATFVLVRYGLMELTNFSVSNLNYLYEGIASSILASPKAYIILLMTALIASRMNLYYGWEFNGILIPSLLALQWYQPTKLLVTFVEVGVILVSAHVLLKLPLFANINLSGARKLFFFFTIGFVYKLLLGHGLVLFFPQIKVTDYYAFGYLIATLLAIKIHDKAMGIRVVRATLQTSLAAVVLASGVGFALSFIPTQLRGEPGDSAPTVAPPTAEAGLEEYLLRQRMLDYEAREIHRPPQPNGSQLDAFQNALESLHRYRATADSQRLREAQRELHYLDYEVVLSEGRYLVIRERGRPRGWGTYVIDSRIGSDLVIEVPAAAREHGIIEAGLTLFRHQQALALAVGSALLGSREGDSADVTRNPDTLFHRFHQTLGARDALQVRLITRQTARRLQGMRDPEPEGAALDGAGDSLLLVKQELPEDLQLKRLEQLLGNLKLRWDAVDIPNVQRERSRTGFAELYLHPDALRPLLARSFQHGSTAAEIEEIRGSLRAYLLGKAATIRELGNLPFTGPSLGQLLFLDAEVLTPLVALVRRNARQDAWPDASLRELRYLDYLAQGVGYRILRYLDRDGDGQRGDQYLILDGAEAAARQWGTYVIRAKPGSAQIVEVPRPVYEDNTLEVGVALFEHLGAQALLIAGSAPFADPRGRADVINPANRLSVFNLVHQTLVRAVGDTPLTISQVRGLGAQAATRAPSLVAFESGLIPQGLVPESRKDLLRALASLGLAPEEVGGAPESAGYEVGFNAQARYLAATRDKEFATVWVAARARRAFAQQSDDWQQQAQFQALGIVTRSQPLIEHVGNHGVGRLPLPARLTASLTHYVETRDIVALRQLLSVPGFSLTRLVEPTGGQAFLLISTAAAPTAVVAIANLSPLTGEIVDAEETALPEVLERFVRNRAFLLRFGASP
ncbi:MAG: poly-gamma-glutamate biosynthesis protein PgsC/CapC [Porticoccaceae bacterium]